MAELLHKPFAQYYLFALLIVVPVARIFMRAGFKMWWTALLAVPDIGFILCAAALTFQKWPKGKKS